MKLAQFKTKDSERRRLGILIDNVVCDVADLARAAKSAGRAVPEWLLTTDTTIEIIKRGAGAAEAVTTIVNSTALPGQSRGGTVAYRIDSIDFLPAVYPSKILAIGRNYADHAAEGGAELPKAPLLF